LRVWNQEEYEKERVSSPWRFYLVKVIFSLSDYDNDDLLNREAKTNITKQIIKHKHK